MKSDDFGQVYDFRRISDVFNLSNRECVIRWLDQYGGVAGYFICVYVFLHGSSAEEGTAEEKELTGTIDEIKDFMFVVTDENDTPYSFTFEEKPEGLENVSNGDTVTVKYTGTISEVDPFEGEVLSVEKAK